MITTSSDTKKDITGEATDIAHVGRIARTAHASLVEGGGLDYSVEERVPFGTWPKFRRSWRFLHHHRYIPGIVVRRKSSPLDRNHFGFRGPEIVVRQDEDRSNTGQQRP